MRMRMLGNSAIVGLLVLMAGCKPAKLHESRTIQMEDQGDIKSVIMPPQPKVQRLTIEVESPEEVDVFVADAKKVNPDKIETFGNLTAAMQREQSIVSKEKVTKETITAEIPANTEYSVIFANPKKKTEVKLLLTNQKK